MRERRVKEKEIRKCIYLMNELLFYIAVCCCICESKKKQLKIENMDWEEREDLWDDHDQVVWTYCPIVNEFMYWCYTLIYSLLALF